MLIQGSSFPIFGNLYGGKTHWSVTDAKDGVVAEGYLTVGEALAVTRPSVWQGYEARGDKLK